MSRRRPEARLEREVLLRIGSIRELSVFKNPVGQGYYGDILPIIRKELERWPRGLAVVEGILMRNRVTYGLGVGSPDLVVNAAGLFGGLELKVPGKAAKPHQREWHETERKKGARIEVVHSAEEAEEAVIGWLN